MFTPLQYLTSLFRSTSPSITHSVETELVEAVNEVGEIIILEIPKIREKRVSSPLFLAPEYLLFEP
jgi:hypothetical protein